MRILPLQREPLQSLYNLAYAYKRLEDPLRSLLRAYPGLLHNGDVVDAGANVGYTTLLFASRVGAGYNVHAFEPETANLQLLEKNIRRSLFASRIVIHPAAAGARSGRAQLRVNPRHPGDHRIVTHAANHAGEVVPVEVLAIDDVMHSRPVSFVKVDVQGFELEVSRGMEATLQRNAGIAVALKYAPASLRELGFDPARLILFYTERGFLMWVIEGARLRATTAEKLTCTVTGNDYVNLLFRRATP